MLTALAAAISFAPRAVAEEKPAAEQAAAKGSDAGPAQDRGISWGSVSIDAGAGGRTGTTPITSNKVSFAVGAADADAIVLPTYRQLSDAGVRRYCNVSVEQEKKLKSISQTFQAHLQELNENAAKSMAKPSQFEAVRKQWRDDMAAYRKKIQDVLTTEQVAEYKCFVMGQQACLLLDRGLPEVAKATKVDLSAQQVDQLVQLRKEWSDAAHRNGLQESRQLLAILSPEQRRTLMASLPGADAAAPRVFVPPRSFLFDISVDSAYSPLFRITDSRGASVAVCPELTENAVRKELGLTGRQQDRLLAIAKNFKAAAQQAFKIYPANNEALDKLSSKEQEAKRAECEQKLQEIGSDAGRQIEAVLGPQQWASLQRKAEERHEVHAADQLLVNDAALRKLNLTPQQRAKLRESAFRASDLTLFRATADKALAVLTAEQQKKLEERLDQQGW